MGVGVCVALAALSGCGENGGHDLGTVHPTKTSKSVPANEPAVFVTPHVKDTITGKKLGAALTATSKARMTGHWVQKVNGGAQHQEGDFDLREPASAHSTSVGVGGDLEIVSLKGQIWIKGFPKSAKPWSKIDMGGGDNVSKLFIAVAGNAQTYSPALYTQMIEGSTGTITKIAKAGEQTQVTTEFTLSVAEYTKPLGSFGQSVAGGTIEGPVTLSVMTTLKGVPVSVATKDIALGKASTKKLVYSHWAEPVHITAPPASDVGAPPDLLGD